MSRAQAMAQREREAAGEATDPSGRPGWFKLLLLAGGVGLAAAWITSPTRRAREEAVPDDRPRDERGDRGYREDRDDDDDRYRGQRESRTCACGGHLPRVGDRDDDHNRRERDREERG